MPAHETRYAQNAGGDSIAYQVVGDGPVDLVFVPGFVSHLELAWAEPSLARFYERLASFSRLILFDKRGTGLSDPVLGPLSLEERMEDFHAVIDAVGADRVMLLGLSEGVGMSLLFASTYPERVSALVLCGAILGGRGHPAGERWRASFEEVRRSIEHWGDGETLRLLWPSAEATSRQRGAFERACASPRMVKAVVEMWDEIDLRDVLPHVHVPTLVLHRSDEHFPVESARYLESQLPDSRLVEMPGTDHVPWSGDSERYLDEIEEFLTGSRERSSVRRSLATVLFTDIVGSTEHAARIGDTGWRDLVARHDALVRRDLRLFDGREVKHTGDGVLATFDGPARGIRCAQHLVESAAPELGLQLRAGLHTGECEIVGDDLRGMAVHIGARVCAAAGPGEVLVSSTVKELVVGSGLAFVDRGVHSLKGVPGEWRLHLATTADSGADQARVDSPERAAHQTLVDRAGLAVVHRFPRFARFALKAERAAVGRRGHRERPPTASG